jgi:hypothetical protein
MKVHLALLAVTPLAGAASAQDHTGTWQLSPTVLWDPPGFTCGPIVFDRIQITDTNPTASVRTVPNTEVGTMTGTTTSFQCVVPPVMRGGLLTGTGTPGLCDGTFSQDLNARWCPSCSAPPQNPGVAAVVQAQLWYRDPGNTSNQTTSLSDAIEFTICN